MWKIITGNNVDVLRTYEDNTFDSVVTDPPYGIAFLNKSWDQDTGALETWQECFRVLKPGGHLLAFSAARTYHHLASNIEQSGFEIRDQLMWLYGSGFPKAQDMGKALDKRGVENNLHGWKTALKPAHEPIVMARKPFKGSAIDNVLEYGVGVLNIDASRIGNEEITTSYNPGIKGKMAHGHTPEDNKTHKLEPHRGRFPSNVIMDEEAGAILDAQAPKTGNASSSKRTKTGMTGTGASLQWHKKAGESNGISDGLSGASKFFYCPKVSRAERHVGFETKNIPTDNPTNGGNYYGTTTHPTDPKLRNYTQDGTLGRMKDKMHQPQVGNNHPTVKPVELMKYLVRLVTPANGRVLDPFNGSGSTGMACVELGYDYVSVELDENYVEIAEKRIKAWENKHKGFSDLFEENA